MHTIRPLPVEYIVPIAETLRGKSVLVDGYDGAALVGAVAELATHVVAVRPHLYTDWDSADDMASYVTRALSHRGIVNFEALSESEGADWWHSAVGAPADAIVIDQGPDEMDVAERVRRALAMFGVVVVIDRFWRHTAELTAIARERAGFIYYGEPPVVYVLGPGAVAVIPIGGQ